MILLVKNVSKGVITKRREVNITGYNIDGRMKPIH